MRFSKILWPVTFSASVLLGGIALVHAQPAQATGLTATAQPTKTTSQFDKRYQAQQKVRQKERQQYLQAHKAIASNNMGEYRKLRAQLQDYPLLPYLEYDELIKRLHTLPKQDVSRFLTQYPDSFLSERLTHRWLRTLAQRERWSDYRHFYDTRLTDPELACLNLRARLATGDNTALADVDTLWNVGKTQSKACDPVFAIWSKAGRMTPGIIWERHAKVVNAGDKNMTAYLSKLLPTEDRAYALLYQQVDANPKLLKQQAKFAKQSPKMQAVILHGLEKYARSDAKAALALWRGYDAQHLFDDEARLNLKYHIALRLLAQKHEADAHKLVATTPALSRVDLLEGLIRESLRKLEWKKVNELLARLPEDAKKTERWRYWQARTMEELHIKEINGETPTTIYASIAPTRSYYGFIAADKTGVNYHLLDRPVIFTEEQLTHVEHSPGIQRAREFYARGEFNAASREWFYSTRRMPSEQITIAGRLAERWGWYRYGIQAMVDANYWDDLEVRFPIVYKEHVAKAAKNTSVNPLFIFAITRQESAFMHDAKSSAGAMGLMQLLPSTAQETARRNGLSFQVNDLLTPEKNIALGSQYLNQMLDSFGGNRILAAAAYNAGPGRVRQWLKGTKSQLPYDVWIETIPFKETRGYVQNVLSFSVIYAYRLGETTQFITPQELTRQL